MEDGWEVKEFNSGTLFEIIFNEDGQRSVEFTVTKAQFEDLQHTLIDVR